MTAQCVLCDRVVPLTLGGACRACDDTEENIAKKLATREYIDASFRVGPTIEIPTPPHPTKPMTRPTPRANDLVSEKRMVQLMSEWAQAADASITQKLAELKAELRAEFTVLAPAPTDAEVDAAIAAHPIFGPVSRNEVAALTYGIADPYGVQAKKDADV